MTSPTTLSVPARGDQLALIADFVTQAAQRSELSERAIYHIQTAVDEACANIICHAYEFEGQGPIEVRCERQQERFVITLTDHGQPFDPTTIPTPDIKASLDERKEGGLGYYLMRQLMDEVHYESLGRSNVMRLVKIIRQPMSDA